MQCNITTDNSDGVGHITPHQPTTENFVQHEENGEEMEKEQSTEEALVVAMGNAAKAARRVGLQQQQRLRTMGSAKGKPETSSVANDDQNVQVGDIERNTTTAYYVNGYEDDADGEVCYTTTNYSTTTTAEFTDGAAAATTTENEKKNETCTLNASRGSNIPATTTTTCTTTTHDDDEAVVVDDEDDYVVGNYGEEVDRAYKTSGAATLSQSEHIVQQQQQQRRAEQGLNALISNVGLFLDQTWNWLHYFLVTIIFLNFVHFANRRESVVGEARSVGEVEGVCIEEEEEESENNSCVQVEESGNITHTNNCTSVIDENNSTLEENSISAEIIMSPNTCSIQNQQEVEKAEEAIMAVGVTTSGEKAEAAVEAPIITTTPAEEEEVLEENKQQQQITIVLPSAEQVVVSGEDASTSDDSNSENNDLAGIRRDSVDSYASSEGSGNLGDIEAEACDRSSEDGSSISSSGITDENTGKQIAQKIIFQVESMFSDEHLAKDGFLLKHVRRRSDGFVSLKLVAGLRKVKQISREFPVVLDALKDSSKLEINSDGTKVRRVEPLTSFLKSVPIKSKDKEKGSKDSSSNDENQLPSATIHQNNKSPSKSGNKENGNNENGNKQGGGNQSRRNSNANNGNSSRRNSNAQGGNSHHRKSSNTSTASSNSSRHNSFSKAGIPPPSQHPADLFRNVYMAAYSSSGEESPQGRRRGGSLPIAALNRASQNGAYLSPNSSPPNGTLIIGPNGARPKSNSYCEGASPTTMSPWLQRRKASASSRLSNGELTFNGVIRQPRGPDGTKGFATGYRAMILEERLQQQQNSAVSA